MQHACKGRWAAEYGHNQNLTFEEMDRVLTEAKELGTHACLFTDGEFAGGCVAGGRIYCHINAAGDVEPCVFIHYSGANIREKSFLECLQQPLFKEYRKGQPFNNNHLRPCPMLENPEYLPQMVARSGAHSTDHEARERGAPVRQMQGLRRLLASRGRKALGRGALRVNDFSVTFPDTQESRRPSGRRLLPHFRILYLTAASRASTRSVFSQATPRSSRPMWP